MKFSVCKIVCGAMLLGVCVLVCSCILCLCQSNDYELVPADVRNIIFVGRSRSGKTTSIEVLKDKDHNPGDFKILRETKTASVQSFTMSSKQQNQNLHFNVMDTPGLFEYAEKGDHRTNDVILGVIKKCIDVEITKVRNCFCAHGPNTTATTLL